MEFNSLYEMLKYYNITENPKNKHHFECPSCRKPKFHTGRSGGAGTTGNSRPYGTARAYGGDGRHRSNRGSRAAGAGGTGRAGWSRYCISPLCRITEGGQNEGLELASEANSGRMGSNINRRGRACRTLDFTRST